MKTNHAIIISLLALLIGLLIGYLFGVNSFPHHNAFADYDTHNHLTDHEGQSFNHHHSMGGMMPGMMSNFSGSSDAEYEQVWLESMIIHHKGALHMTEDLLERTDRPELIEFGKTIIDTQSEEIETMQTWLNNWFNQQ